MGVMAIPYYKELWYSPITREDHNEKHQSVQQGTYQKLKLVNTWTWGWYVTTVPVQYSKIPLIQHPTIWKFRQSSWGGGVPKTQTVAFYQKKKMHHQWNRQISVTCSKMPPRWSVHQTLWYLLTPYLLFHHLLQLWRLQKAQKRTLITLNQQTKEMNQAEHSSIQLHDPSKGTVTKYYLQELKSV